MASLSAQYQRSIPPVYGQSAFENILGDYLPISGGTMNGDIDMSGHKITNLGQQNLQSSDAVTKATVDSLIANRTVENPTFSISSSPEISTITPTAGKSLLLPGILSGNANSTNWNLVQTPNGTNGYRLGTNNVCGFSKNVRLTCLFNLDISTVVTSPITARLTLMDKDTETIIATGTINVPTDGSQKSFTLTVVVPIYNNKDFDDRIAFLTVEHTEPFTFTGNVDGMFYIIRNDL